MSLTENPDVQRSLDRPIGLPLDFLRLLWAVNHGLAVLSRRSKQELEVTEHQRLLLQVVKILSPTSPSALAKALHVHPSTLTGLIRRMSAKGLIQVAVNGRDRRRLKISLTSRGRRTSAMGQGEIEEAVVRTLAVVSPATRNRALDVLSQLAADLETITECRPSE